MNTYDLARDVGYWKERAYQAEKQRDHWRYTFAGMAMQGFMSSTQEEYGGFECESKLAEHSVKYADALLRELEGEG